jgi:hypothetical protein
MKYIILQENLIHLNVKNNPKTAFVFHLRLKVIDEIVVSSTTGDCSGLVSCKSCSLCRYPSRLDLKKNIDELILRKTRFLLLLLLRVEVFLLLPIVRFLKGHYLF